jgi:anion-transporting  ArsA/GET3 family ATPase
MRGSILSFYLESSLKVLSESSLDVMAFDCSPDSFKSRMALVPKFKSWVYEEISEEEALKITKELVKEADESKAIIKAAMKGEKGRVPVVIVNKYKHTIDLALSNDKMNLLKLNHEHYNKLSALWRLAHDKDSKHIGEPLASGSKEEKVFHDDLYSLVLRYVTLQGPGF